MEKKENRFNLEMTTHRLEAFSDGVFAIAITLLILEVKIPKHEDIAAAGGLKNFLLELWPSYFAYIMSFVNIGIYWANHHYLFKLYERTDHVFNILNIFFLMSISFLPYPTAILGDYIMDEEQRATAVSLYSLGMVLPAFFWLMGWLYATNNKRLIDTRLEENFIQQMTRLYIMSNVFYILALAVSFFYPLVSVSISVVLTFLYLLPPKRPVYKTA